LIRSVKQFLSFCTQTKPGAGLEGCLYAKNSSQKTARSMQHSDRFLFL
jgi:hypothetical protein